MYRGGVVSDVEMGELLDMLSQSSVVFQIESDLQEVFSESLFFFLEVEVVFVVISIVVCLQCGRVIWGRK